MVRKYHVFISSTQDDLKNERTGLTRLIWEMGHIPVCPDGFDITNENDRRLIKRLIGDCDYFLSLAAHKYGTLAEGISETEIEYACAVKMGIPVFGLLIGEKARWKDSKRETDPALVRALDDFKRQLQTHPHIFWMNGQDLTQKAGEFLVREMFMNPRNGWTVGDSLGGPPAANIMSRLIAENEDMKRQIAVRDGTEGPWKSRMKHTLSILAGYRISLSFFYNPGETWENTIKCRYLRLFHLLTPELYLGKTTEQLSRFLGSILNPDLARTVRKDFPTPSNTIKKIMTDFHLLKLVHYTGTKSKGSWELSGYGKEVYALYRMRQFDRNLKNSLNRHSGSAAPEEAVPEAKAKPRSSGKTPPAKQRGRSKQDKET
ncbi:MAG: DUF4062 domain-containing protein [Spirochaetaceae bacterium]|jgi:hypothetical protein|nr:DUF4062 domain-containing protein [Spirochaetaceae bacterium]